MLSVMPEGDNSFKNSWTPIVCDFGPIQFRGKKWGQASTTSFSYASRSYTSKPELIRLAAQVDLDVRKRHLHHTSTRLFHFMLFFT
jgi:hypothetical protein